MEPADGKRRNGSLARSGTRIDADTAAVAASVPRSFSEWLAELIALGTVLVTAVVTLTVWPRLPARVPAHFSLSGQVDAWGSKNSLLVLLVATVVIYGGLTFVSRFPRWFNYPVRVTADNLRAQYRLARWLLSWVKVAAVVLLSGMGLISVAIASGMERILGLAPPRLTVILVACGVVAELTLIVAYIARAWAKQRVGMSRADGVGRSAAT